MMLLLDNTKSVKQTNCDPILTSTVVIVGMSNNIVYTSKFSFQPDFIIHITLTNNYSFVHLLVSPFFIKIIIINN